MKTPEEIKKGLAACKVEGDCDRGNCPYYHLGTGIKCIPALTADALAYIQQLEDHIREQPNMVTNGAIISGYQSIGKSTLAKNVSGYVDLESGNFFVNGTRADNWYVPYCQIAVHLAQQGYRVFVSSHLVVRQQLAAMHADVPLFVCFPSHTLRIQWCKKLERRYNVSGLDKDYRAWQNAVCTFDDNIKSLHETDGFVPIVIHDMDYSLDRLLDKHCSKRNSLPEPPKED